MARILTPFAAALVALAGVAGAAEQRRPPREADLGAKRSVAPDASLGGSLQAKRPGAAEARGPTLDYESFRKVVEVDISQKRREEIASLQKLIKLGGGSDTETPQWYFRLAELLWEESQYFFFEANRRDDRILALGRTRPDEVARLQDEKRQYEAESKRHQDQAVSLYKAIVQRYPKYPRLDEVLYFLAQNLSKRNKGDPNALKAYRAIIQRFPRSRFVPDAWMAFGEYYFDKANAGDRTGNLKVALDAYRHAAEYQESSVYGYALYKQAWVHYNLGNWTEALELFRGVIFFGELPTSTVPADRKMALVKEARKDYVRTYSHVGSAEGAWDEFHRIGGQGWWDMLKTLGGLYFDEGKDRDAVLIYARMMREKPRSFEAPYFQSRIVTCAGRMGRKDAAVQQAHVFVQLIRDLEALPEAREEKNRKLLADARRDAESTLRILAVQYHNEWKKTRDDPVAGYAAAVYRDYLDVFPREPTAYEMRFFHAELLYALAQFEEAGRAYERVALEDMAAAQARAAPGGAEAPKPGKFFKDALENAVFAYDLVVKKLDETEKRPTADPRKRLPVSPPRQKLLEACERYLKWQPKGDKWVEVAYKAANLYYRHNAFAEATDLFTRIALDHPTHELAGYATNLVLDAYNLLGDWRNVSGWAKRFYQNRALLDAHPGLREDLGRIIEQSAFKVIEERERARDHEAAAEEYLAFARDWPTSHLAPTALFNASVDLVKAHRLDRAMEIREAFLQRYPNDKLAPQCLYDNAEAYEAVADFEQAAERYERYFAAWHRQHGGARAPRARARAAAATPAAPAAQWDEKKANDAIVNAAVFRAGLRQWAKAEAATAAYLDAWPNGPDASRLSLALADLYEKQGKVSAELKQLESYRDRVVRDPDEWLATQFRIARLMERAGNQVGARKVYADGLAFYRRNPGKVRERGLAVVAQAQYLDLEPDFAEYDRINFRVAPALMKRQLEIKGAKLKRLEDAYRQIVKLKQAEPAICALYRIGLGYRRFAQALHDAPVPAEIRAKAEYVEEYKAQLAQLTDPLETKAVEGLALAVTASRDYGVVNACAREATALLVKVKPELYGASPEVVPEFRAPRSPEALAGYGLLADVQPVPAAAPAPRRTADAPPPPLRPRQAGATAPAPRGPERADPDDPQQRIFQPEAAPRKQKGNGDEDEDLLP